MLGATLTERTRKGAFWRREAEKLRAELQTPIDGLSPRDAATRLQIVGANRSIPSNRYSFSQKLLRRLLNPLVLILVVAAAVSGMSGDIGSFVVIIAVISLSLVLDIVQEHRAERAAEALRQSVAIQVDVLRGGELMNVPAASIVPGDIVLLRMGDLVPADGVVLDQEGLQLDESLLTGEAFPVSKSVAPALTTIPSEAQNALFAGTSVVAGRGSMLVVETGNRTRFGAIAAAVETDAAPTALEEGVRRIGLLIVRLTIFLTLFVLLAHLASGRPALPSFLFAVALAVGLTPELLPMIMTVTLAKGAQRMATQQVIVKRLSAIHDFGALDVLCVDKTGTLTQAKIRLTEAIGADGTTSDRVHRLATVNSHFQSGMRSPMDEAVLRSVLAPVADDCVAFGEIPFDFSRRCLSVAATIDGKALLVTKGAPEAVIAKSIAIETEQRSIPLGEDWRRKLEEVQQRYQDDGYRLLGVAIKELSSTEMIQLDDEAELTFVGFCVFADPVKPDAASAVAELAALGVTLKIISGDQLGVVRHVAAQVGVAATLFMTGADIDELSDPVLAERVRCTDLFARVDPGQKQRVIDAFRRSGHVVGFLGDGVNDAPAIHAAHVGISVQGATEVARAAADMILLAPSLSVLAAGVREGRRTIANILKYVRMATSSNFGNMLSMALASVILPFLPLLPLQILLNNLLYDLSEIGIPFDSVEADDIARPRIWDMNAIFRFTAVMGAISSVFDLATFYVLLHVVQADEAIFQTGWFTESILTQILVIFIIRSSRPPWRAMPPHPVLVLTSLGAVVGALLLVFSPVRVWFGFALLPLQAIFGIFLLALGYLVAAQAIKRWATSSHVSS